MYTITNLKVWLWNNGRELASWHFVTIPSDVGEELHMRFSENKRGFGSLKVEVSIGETQWQTSLFPDNEKNTFLLPLKAAVRKAEDINDGDTVDIRLKVL